MSGVRARKLFFWHGIYHSMVSDKTTAVWRWTVCDLLVDVANPGLKLSRELATCLWCIARSAALEDVIHADGTITHVVFVDGAAK